jgi:hypothetical protein
LFLGIFFSHPNNSFIAFYTNFSFFKNS